MRGDLFELEPGQAVDRYELLLPVATDSTSQVWAARLRGTRGFEKLVGLKALAVPGSENGKLERLLWREAKLASQIQHPNVVQYFDLIEHAGILCLTMEWVDGESLSSLLRMAPAAGGIPIGVAVQVIVQACKGLHAAHELRGADGQPLGLAHCDLSPQNLWIDTRGTVKLVDFGIAKVRRMSPDNEDGMRSSPSFVAPDSALERAADFRSDLFSLGILLYLLTTGRHPFRSANANAGDTLRAIRGDVPVARPSTLVENYPVGLERVVLRAMSCTPAQRFQSAAEMLGELTVAFPGYASETELAALLGRLCENSLSSRRTLVNEALRRHSAHHSASDSAGSEQVHAPLTAPTSDTLSPAYLAAAPTHSSTAAHWRSIGVALAVGAFAFVAAFAWTLAQPATSPRSQPAPAAQTQSVERPALSQELAEPEPRPTTTLPSAVPALPAPPSSSKPLIAPASKKRKPQSVERLYGI